MQFELPYESFDEMQFCIVSKRDTPAQQYLIIDFYKFLWIDSLGLKQKREPETRG
jgi:hypothetical protein